MRRFIRDSNLYIDWFNTGAHEPLLFQSDAVKMIRTVVIGAVSRCPCRPRLDPSARPVQNLSITGSAGRPVCGGLRRRRWSLTATSSRPWIPSPTVSFTHQRCPHCAVGPGCWGDRRDAESTGLSPHPVYPSLQTQSGLSDAGIARSFRILLVSASDPCFYHNAEASPPGYLARAVQHATAFSDSRDMC